MTKVRVCAYSLKRPNIYIAKRDLYTGVLIRACQVFVGGLAWLKSCIVKSLADARPPALLALAPAALVLADARPPALLACAPAALVLEQRTLLHNKPTPPLTNVFSLVLLRRWSCSRGLYYINCVVKS